MENYKLIKHYLAIMLWLSFSVNAQAVEPPRLNQSATGSNAIQNAGKAVVPMEKKLQAGADASVDLVQDNDLTGLLVKQLGVSEAQAQGGAGAIFQAAQKQMSAEDFQKLSDNIPEIDSMLGAAPKQSEKANKLAGKLSAILGDKNKHMDSAIELIDAFKSLHLSSDEVKQFIPVVVDYVKQNTGEASAEQLQSLLLKL